MTELKTKGNLTYRCVYRAVWFTQRTRRIFEDETLRNDLQLLLWEATNALSVDVISCEILPDGVDIRIGFDPRRPLHKTIKDIKNKTAGGLKARHPELKRRMSSIWTYKYLASTEGALTEEEIAEYHGQCAPANKKK